MPQLLLSLFVIVASAAYVFSVGRPVDQAAAKPAAAADEVAAIIEATPPAEKADPAPAETAAIAPLPPPQPAPAPDPATAPDSRLASLPPAPRAEDRTARATPEANDQAHSESYYLAQPSRRDRPDSLGRNFRNFGTGIRRTTNPPAGDSTAAVTNPRVAANTPPPAPQAAPAPAPTPAPALAAKPVAAKFKDGTFTGRTADAYFGLVQVRAVIKGGKLTSVEVIDYPADRSRSRRINDYALPVLQREVIAAQSANVDIISGATLTCEAYAQSLATALAQAKG